MSKSFLKKVADVYDAGSNLYSEQYRFQKTRGKYGLIEIPRAEARDIKAFRTKLLNAGAELPKDDRAFIEAAVAGRASQFHIYAKKAGWTRNKAGYVLPNEFIGPKRQRTIIGIKQPTGAGAQGRMFNSGTTAQWTGSVGRLSSRSSMAMTAICAAFAAPLLSLRRQESFGICFSGSSRSGKTTLIQIAGSIIGFRERSNLLSWNLTDAALEERLPTFNDSIFAVDDLQAMGGTDTARSQRIQETAYRLAQGHMKLRSSSVSIARTTDGSWSTILLTSNERPLNEIAASRNSDLGGAVRLIDIPVGGTHGNHIFDRAEDGANASLRRKQFEELRVATGKYHGAVFRRYISQLLALSDNRDAIIARSIAHFRRAVIEPHDTAVARDIAEKFGLLYAAGRLSMRFGILPWTQTALLSALKTSYRAARSRLPNDYVTSKNGKKLLRAKLEQLPTTADWTQGSDGFLLKKPTPNFILRCEAFNAIFESPHQRAIILKWLITTKRIELSETSASTSPSPKLQFRWPDGSRRRSYRIFLKAN